MSAGLGSGLIPVCICDSTVQDTYVSRAPRCTSNLGENQFRYQSLLQRVTEALRDQFPTEKYVEASKYRILLIAIPRSYSILLNTKMSSYKNHIHVTHYVGCCNNVYQTRNINQNDNYIRLLRHLQSILNNKNMTSRTWLPRWVSTLYHLLSV